MTVTKLSLPEKNEYGFSHIVKITYADISVAALTKVLAIYPESGSAPVGTQVRAAGAKVVTPFVGCTTCVVEVGDGGDVDRNLVSYDIAGAAAGEYKVAVPSTTPSVFNTADTVDAKFTATVDNLSALTAGEVWIFLNVSELNTLLTN